MIKANDDCYLCLVWTSGLGRQLSMSGYYVTSTRTNKLIQATGQCLFESQNQSTRFKSTDPITVLALLERLYVAH